MQPIIIEKGNAVSVDWNNYDLSIDQAATELLEGRNIVAREYEDFSLDNEFSFPDVIELEAVNYKGKTIDQIIDDLREFESYGRASLVEEDGGL